MIRSLLPRTLAQKIRSVLKIRDQSRATNPPEGSVLTDHEARLRDFVSHCNKERLHSAIGYLTPEGRLAGKHEEIWAARDRKLDEARERRKRNRAALRIENLQLRTAVGNSNSR